MRVTAEEMVTRLQGMQVFVVATTTVDGRPGPARSTLSSFTASWALEPPLNAMRARHIARNPAVSATHLEGEPLAVTGHGTAVLLDLERADRDLAVDSLWFRIGRFHAQQLHGFVAQDFVPMLDAGGGEYYVPGPGLDRLTVDGPAHTTGTHHEDVILIVGVEVGRLTGGVIVYIDGDSRQHDPFVGRLGPDHPGGRVTVGVIGHRSSICLQYRRDDSRSRIPHVHRPGGPSPPHDITGRPRRRLKREDFSAWVIQVKLPDNPHFQRLNPAACRDALDRLGVREPRGEPEITLELVEREIVRGALVAVCRGRYTSTMAGTQFRNAAGDPHAEMERRMDSPSIS